MVIMSTSTATQIRNQKTSENKKATSAVNRGSCETLHAKLKFADPVFKTPGILSNENNAYSMTELPVIVNLCLSL